MYGSTDNVKNIFLVVNIFTNVYLIAIQTQKYYNSLHITEVMRTFKLGGWGRSDIYFV